MKALAVLLVLTLVTPAAALGAEPLARTFTAPVDRVWTVTEGILKILGWDIDKADRRIGFITTESRQVEGENYGVYEKGTRHRLRSEEHTSELQSLAYLVCRLLLEK